MIRNLCVVPTPTPTNGPPTPGGTTRAPTNAPTPVSICSPGKLGCDCRTDRTCLSGEGSCDNGSGKCVKPACTPGTPGCVCRSTLLNQCDAPTTCNQYNYCASNSCVFGQVSCPCRTDGSCQAGSVCFGNNCVQDACQAGQLGCVCNAGACAAGLTCRNSVCSVPEVSCPEGTLTCPCRPGSTDKCNAGLGCNIPLNRCEVAFTQAPTPQPTPVGQTPQPTPVGQLTPMPTPVPGGSPTPEPTPMPGPSGCIAGGAGCACLDGATCGSTLLQCSADKCIYKDATTCVKGAPGCGCLADNKCAGKATCASSGLCELEYKGDKPPKCLKTSDRDYDGVQDCSDIDTTLGQTPPNGTPPTGSQVIQNNLIFF